MSVENAATPTTPASPGTPSGPPAGQPPPPTQPAPDAGDPAAKPPTGEASAAAGAAPGDAPAGEPPAEPEGPQVPELAKEVLAKRDAQAVSKLMREKRQLEAQKAEIAGQAARLEAYGRVEKLLEQGDEAGAIEALLQAKYGDKARERLASTYDSLTSRILNVDSKPSGKVERDLARLQQRLEEQEQARAKAEAEAQEAAARDYESRTTAAKQGILAVLQDSTDAYQALQTECDAPAEVVWELIEEGLRRGEAWAEGDPNDVLKHALEMADAYYQPTYNRKAEKYRNSLLAQKAAGDTPSKPEPTKSTPSAPRKSLTNADASEAPTLQQPPTFIADREKSIDEVQRILRERKAAQPT